MYEEEKYAKSKRWLCKGYQKVMRRPGRQMRRPRLITGAGSLTDRVQADSQADLPQLSRDLRGPGKSRGAEL